MVGGKGMLGFHPQQPGSDMGIFDKAKDLTEKAEDAAQLAKEHADKVPGDMGDKIAEVADQIDDLADKVPGNDQDD